jgi:KAP family P-loop domain
MVLIESSLRVRLWWGHGGRRAARNLWRRLALGSVVGSLISVALHVITRDSQMFPLIHRRWSEFSYKASFDGIGAYEKELIWLCIGIAAIAIPWALKWLLGYARAWWAGITSMVFFFAAVETISALNPWAIASGFSNAIGLTSMVVLSAMELWRQQVRILSGVSGDLNLNIPLGNTSGPETPQWAANASDNPIADWASDIVGRAPVVELLADYALCQRIPVLALHGGLGDGKTSVLNLLKVAVERKAIVVSFSAWLPGSETSLAAELFNDIANECKKRVHVPQLRKRSLAFARMVSGSVTQLSALKEMIPSQSQQEEIEELCDTFSRIPMPIVVLLDEIDRMQKDELLVLLKILRGASSIPNVTFVCAFSENDIEREIGKEGSQSHDYMEKFFPVSVKLSGPAPEIIQRCLLPLLRKRLAEQKWFRNEQEEAKFTKLLEDAWADSFQPLCTNLRKAGMLLNDVVAAGRPIAGEVNPFDLVAIEAIRLFCPDIYQMVRTGVKYLTDEGKNELIIGRSKGQDSFAALNNAIDRVRDPAAARSLLSLLFPEYASSLGDRLISYMTASERRDDRGRICDSEYFPIYFRAAVPEEMFSNAELTQTIAKLGESMTETDAEVAFSAVLDSIPAGYPKRADFLWKLSREVGQLSDIAAEYLAYAAAARAADYQYDLWTLGELGRALNIILKIAQKLSDTLIVQRVLEGAMARASDDTLAIKILNVVENPSLNEALTNFVNVNAPAIKGAFIQRMRARYVPDSALRLAQSDWQALRCWVENSEEDRVREQAYLRAFIGRSRKKLAQVINVIYPGGGIWEDNPVPLVDRFFPIKEIEDLLREVPDDEPLDEAEKEGIARMQRLFDGKYSTRSNLGL